MTPEKKVTNHNIPAGIAWMIVTGLLFVCVTAIVRHLGSDMPAIEAAFIRYAIGLVLVLPSFAVIFRIKPERGAMALFAGRGLVHGIAVMLWFFAMARIPIAEVTAIGYTSPLFVTIGAALFLGETMRIRRVVAVIIGLVGVLIILRPGFAELGSGQLAQLAAAPLFAISFLLAKKMTERFDAGVIVAMLSLGCTLVLLPGAVMQWRQPTWEEMGWLTATAVFATVGHYTLTQAFKSAPITVTQPVSFLQLVWAMLTGMILFAEPFDIFVFAGGAVIVGAATYISYRETLASRRPPTPPAAATKL